MRLARTHYESNKLDRIKTKRTKRTQKKNFFIRRRGIQSILQNRWMHDLTMRDHGWIFLVVCQVCSLRQKCLVKMIPFLRLIQCDGWIFFLCSTVKIYFVLRCRLTCHHSPNHKREKKRKKCSYSFSSPSSLLSFVVLFGSGLWIYINGYIVLKTKPDDTALLGGVQPSSPISKTSSPSSMIHNSISNCSGETTSTNKYATNHLNDITVSIVVQTHTLECHLNYTFKIILI